MRGIRLDEPSATVRSRSSVASQASGHLWLSWCNQRQTRFSLDRSQATQQIGGRASGPFSTETARLHGIVIHSAEIDGSTPTRGILRRWCQQSLGKRLVGLNTFPRYYTEIVD